MRDKRTRLVALVVAAVAMASCGSSDDAPTASSSSTPTTTPTTPTTTTTTTPSGTPVAGGTWWAIPDAPGEAAGAPVWTGEELVVWGGPNRQGRVAADGVAYRPASRQWRALAPSPLDPRSGHSGVWTGAEVLYWGGTHDAKALGEGAAYNPKTDRWRALPRSPLPPRSGHEATWTGREMVIWGGLDQCCAIDSIIHNVAAAAYDPATNRWRRLADVPPPWSGDDGPAVTAATEDHLYVWRDGRLGALDLRADRWRDLGAPPPAARGETECMMSNGPVSVGAFTAERLVVWTGGCAARDGAAYDLRAGTWSRSPDGPADNLMDVVQGPAVFGVAGNELTKLVRLDGQAWKPLDVPGGRFGAYPVMVWTGADILVWGGHRNGGQVRAGIVFRPAP